MAARDNRIKIKLKPSGNVELRLTVANGWGIQERKSFSIPRRVFEKALAEATIEAPWSELLSKLGRQ